MSTRERGFLFVASQPGVSSWWASATNRRWRGPASVTVSTHCIASVTFVKQFWALRGPDSVYWGTTAVLDGPPGVGSTAGPELAGPAGVEVT